MTLASYSDGTRVDWARVRADLDRDGLAIVAHRLASERIRMCGYVTPVPSPVELHVAAREIVERLGIPEFVPTKEVLAEACLCYRMGVLTDRSRMPTTIIPPLSEAHTVTVPSDVGALERLGQKKPK